MDVLEQERVGKDLRPEVAVRKLLSRRGCRDDLPAARTPVPMMPEASHLHPGRDQILLKMLTHLHRRAQRRLATAAPAQCLIDHPVDVVRFGPGHAGMPRLLARALGAPLQERGESVQASPLGSVKMLNETLDFVLERGLFPVEFRDQRNQLPLGKLPNFLAEVL